MPLLRRRNFDVDELSGVDPGFQIGAAERRCKGELRRFAHTVNLPGPINHRDAECLVAEDKVFRPFERAATARHHAGLGLGLWIAQQIAQTSGGGITVQSRVGEGSTFRVELPL